MNLIEARKLMQQQQEEEVKDLVKVSNSLVEGFVSKSNAVALKMLFYIAKQKHEKPNGMHCSLRYLRMILRNTATSITRR